MVQSMGSTTEGAPDVVDPVVGDERVCDAATRAQSETASRGSNVVALADHMTSLSMRFGSAGGSSVQWVLRIDSTLGLAACAAPAWLCLFTNLGVVLHTAILAVRTEP